MEMELFKFAIDICNIFKGITPFSLRNEPADEVFLLMRKLKKFGKQSEGSNAQSFTKQKSKRVTPDTATWW